MANDRLYLRCRCGKQLFLAKHYSDNWSGSGQGPPAIEGFFADHEECFPAETDGAGQFSLVDDGGRPHDGSRAPLHVGVALSVAPAATPPPANAHVSTAFTPAAFHDEVMRLSDRTAWLPVRLLEGGELVPGDIAEGVNAQGPWRVVYAPRDATACVPGTPAPAASAPPSPSA